MSKYRYLTPHPGHESWLDVARLASGFGAYFFAIPVEKTDSVVHSAVNRAKAAVQNGIALLERTARDTTVTEDVRHENAKLLFQNIAKEVSQSIKGIKSHSEREADAARDRAFAVIDKQSNRSDTYAENSADHS